MLDTVAKDPLFTGKMSFACDMPRVTQDSYCRGDENIRWKFQATTKKQRRYYPKVKVKTRLFHQISQRSKEKEKFNT